MTSVNLTTRDINVLEKIKDPESNPTTGVVIDTTLPRDPHIVNDSVYDRIVAKEKSIIQSIQKIEIELSRNRNEGLSDAAAVEGYRHCNSDLDVLIHEFPDYASARNNRAQIARRLYGDAMLLADTATMPPPLVPNADHSERLRAAAEALEDMDTSIQLLSPPNPYTPLSPQAARTLSMAHTQRAAVYMRTAKLMSQRAIDIDNSRREAKWSRLDFEEAASRDLALGGRYGNEIAKGLAVSANPTAKLCGEIVREAMRKEYGPAYAD